MLSDYLGTARLVVGVSDGMVAQRIDVEEFGNVHQDTSPGFQPFGFGGGTDDRMTRLLRFGSRDYDPILGRWTAKDASRFATRDGNLYTYVANAPTYLLDITGHDIWIEGPSPSLIPGLTGESALHYSINIGCPGDPASIFSVSFGLSIADLSGYVYLDTDHGGEIIQYLETSKAEDQIARDILWEELGEKDTYTPGNQCRTYSRKKFEEFERRFGSGGGNRNRGRQ